MIPFKPASRLGKWGMRSVAFGAALALLAGCSLLPAEEEPLSPPALISKQTAYETVDVAKGNLELYIDSTATAVSDTNASLAFPESGAILKKLYVAQGDLVQAGAPIAELDTGDLPLRVKLQRLAVEQRSIVYQDAVKQDSDKNAIRLAKIDLEAEQLQLDDLQRQYAKAMLYAPAGGEVTYLNDIKPGEQVEANETIATISDPTHVNLVYDATDVSKIQAVKKGGEVEVKLDDGKTYKGTVIQTPSTAKKSDDPNVNNRNAKSLVIALADPHPTLRIGSYADIRLFVDKRNDVLVIPTAGLKSLFGSSYVMVVDNNRAKQVDVVIGLKTSNQVEIVKGLDIGQKVIVD